MSLYVFNCLPPSLRYHSPWFVWLSSVVLPVFLYSSFLHLFSGPFHFWCLWLGSSRHHYWSSRMMCYRFSLPNAKPVESRRPSMDTVAILAQGTHWAVALVIAFLLWFNPSCLRLPYHLHHPTYWWKWLGFVWLEASIPSIHFSARRKPEFERYAPSPYWLLWISEGLTPAQP